MTEDEKSSHKTMRIPLSFDCSDETQRMVYRLLKSAGYGKRTPIVVKAVCMLMGCAAQLDRQNDTPVHAELSTLVYDAVKEALRDFFPSGPCAQAENSLAAVPPDRQEQLFAASKDEDPVDKLAQYDLPDDIINSALAFADQFG